MFPLILAALTAVCLLTAPVAAAVPNGALTDSHLRFVGRWDKTDPNVFHSHWGGAYLRAKFTGASVGIRLMENASLLVSIDGERPRAVNAGVGVTMLNAVPLAAGVHSLLVGSPGQNGEVAFAGLTLAPGAKTMPLAARPLVEFVGDSITASGGPDALPIVNYAWQSAESLGCDHVQIAFSARALTSGFGCVDDKTGLDVQYFRLTNFNHADTKRWDFRDAPRVVVINLGQNDQCGGEPDATLTASYVQFVRAIRAVRPKAQIVALRPFGGAYAGAVRRAVETLRAGGEARVHFFDTTGWLEKDDFADGVHPNGAGSVKAARRLVPLLRPLLSLAPAASVVTVGDLKHPGALASAVHDAYVGGARQIVIRPGVYLLPKTGQSAFVLDGWQDVTISARGVTLVMSEAAWGVNCFDFHNCVRVTLVGPTLSQTEIPFYQGRILAVGKNSDGKIYADWRPDAGYPVPPADAKKFPSGVNIVDSRTRQLKLGVGDFWDAPMESRPGGVFRIQFNTEKANFEAGDFLVGRHGNAGFKVHLDGSRDCTVKNVTMLRNGFANVREEGAGGGNRIVGCRWMLGPRPGGATAEPLVTNAADGLHSTGANPGPRIENCVFSGIFLDDCIAIHGYLQAVKSASGNVLTVENGGAGLKIGDPARISDEKGFFGQATVTNLKDNGDKTTTVTLDKDLGVPTGAKLSNPRVNGRGFRIVGCHLGNTRSRGILIKSDDGVIQNNTIENCGMAAVSIGPEYYWNEADYAQNVTVAGNTLRGNGRMGWGGAAILVHGDGAMGNKNITIKDNAFDGNFQGEVDAAWTDGVTVTNNTFIGASPWPNVLKRPTPISVSHARAVTLRGNVIHNPSSYNLLQNKAEK